MHGTVSEESGNFVMSNEFSPGAKQGREFEEMRRRKNDTWRRCDVTTSETPENVDPLDYNSLLIII